MSKNKTIGTALGLALSATALAGCDYSSRSSNQTQPTPTNPSTAGIDSAWNSKTEQQIRDAIANAPANGLKPELFLKGGEKGASLTQAALRYASALANGYADPSKLH